ncbi:hypothetical protein GCM10008090_15000 [Arenicella chitinivorans]|uniref:PepSY domain-containing protein n=2 Tax=Arenicella chitinivorans TaxID=1329800 RepID=A0A918VLS2_9GAMM|nr:hypothetical protein GCM10008090_15000 [Arenicella chitinivorans]
MSVTGVLLVWKKEFLWLSVPGAKAKVERQWVPVAMDRIQAHYAPGEVRSVRLYSLGLAIHKVYLTERRYAWFDQQGHFVQQWHSNERFEDWLLDLHHRFLLGNTVGLNIAGVSGILVFLLCILGGIIWWPRRRSYRLGIRPKSTRREAWLISHGNLGVSFALPIMLLAFTGVLLVYPSESRSVLVSPWVPAATPTTIHSDQEFADWRQRITFVHQQFPGAEVRWISPASERFPAHSIGFQQSDSLNPTGISSLRFAIAEDETAITKSDAQSWTALERLFRFSYPLHTGELGLWYRLLLTVTGLALAGLMLLSMVSYARSSQRWR